MQNSCPLCASHLIHDTRPREIIYREHKATISQIADYCDSCGEAFLSHADSKSTEKEIADFKRRVDHLLTVFPSSSDLIRGSIPLNTELD
ncbi:MAG: type II toxin-antitoxin system MqsA family antitoxin [Sulfurimonas sp.]|jgi:YgiT-type zinc finger domain-containing protein